MTSRASADDSPAPATEVGPDDLRVSIGDSTGKPVKSEYGPWMKYAFKVLAGLRFLRHTRFDPFGHTVERKSERQALVDYQQTIDHNLDDLSRDRLELMVALANLPEKIRGFGHVKAINLAEYHKQRDILLARLQDSRLTHAA